MKAVVLTFDSLNRHMLAPYGCKESHTPNFSRLAEKTVTFDRAYVGSMPCMPARREMHTGRYNFLHRAWGGLEAFDDSMPEILKNKGIHTHHATDHYHYWEDGGHHYMQRYSTHEFFRGQEGDAWKPLVGFDDMPKLIKSSRGDLRVQDEINRQFIKKEEDWPMYQTVSAGLEFLQNNQSEDDWFLHIETFDPHEPFYAPQKYRDLFKHDHISERADWPPYGRTDFFGFDKDTIQQIRTEYLALLAFCDAQLGRVLDYFDEHNLWDNTMLIVNTDHGFFLGEKNLLAKNVMPLYDELSHVPLFVWDPRHGCKGERRDSLVQTIDFAPTLLDYFGVESTPDMQGRSMNPVVREDTSIRKAGLFGYHGGHLNLVTEDGQICMLHPHESVAGESYNYTLTPVTMRGFLDHDFLRKAELHPPFSFTKDMPVLKIPAGANFTKAKEGVPYASYLFNTKEDPGQEHNLIGSAPNEDELRSLMIKLLKESDSPDEIYHRYNLL